MPGFNVNIGANTAQISRSLAQLKQDLVKFRQQLTTSTDPQTIIRLNRAIQETERSIKKISGAQSLNAFNLELKKLPPGADAANFALTNTGRVLQDLPFGFIGIQNNLNPLLESFQRLKAQSGSTKSALKALGSSLIGPGGIGLALSLVSFLVLKFGDSFGSAKKELEGLAKAQAESNKQAGEEIASLKILTAISSDTTRSMQDRKKAATELQDQLKGYNVQLSQEEILNGRVAEATKKATDAIISNAKARAIQARIEELSTKQLDLLLKRRDVQEQINKGLREADRLFGKEGQIAGNESARKSFINDLERVNGLNTKRNKIDQEFLDSGLEIQQLLDRIVKEDVGIKIGDSKTVDALKQRIDALKTLQKEAGLTREQLVQLVGLEIQLASRDAIKLGFTRQELQERINGILESNFPVGTFEFNVTPTVKIEGAEVAKDIDINKALGLDQIDLASFDAVIKKIQEAAAAKRALFETAEAEKLGAFVVDTLGPAFTDLFTDIASGSKSAFQSFAQTIANLIKRILAAAAAAAILSAILKSIFPGAGSAFSFKGIFGAISGFKFADGGIATRPTFGVFGEAGPEAVIPLARLPQILGQATQTNSAGGSFSATIVDGGRDLILLMTRAQKTFGRSF